MEQQIASTENKREASHSLIELIGKNSFSSSERYSHRIPEVEIGSYFVKFGAYRPRKSDLLFTHVLFWVVNTCFYSYLVSVAGFVVYSLGYDHADQRFWVVFNLTMVLKCMMLHIVLVRNAEQVITYPESMQYGDLCARAYPTAFRYFAVASSIFFVIMCGWAVFRLRDFPFYFWVLFAFSIVGGLFGYTCFVSTVMLFCVADTYLIHQKIENLKFEAEKQTLRKNDYIQVHKLISDIKKVTFRNNELILFSVVLNTISLGVVLFTLQTVTNDRGILFTVWFLLYVTSILWVSDVLYLFSVLPGMSKSNDLVQELHVLVASMNWDISAEHHRHDVLHMMVMQPIRIKMFGLLLTKKEMRNRLLGVTAAIVSLAIKLVIEIVNVY